MCINVAFFITRCSTSVSADKYELNCIGILLANVYISLYVKCQFVPICLLTFSCPSFFHTVLDIFCLLGHPVYFVCPYGSETHLREVPIYVKSRIVTS